MGTPRFRHQRSPCCRSLDRGRKPIYYYGDQYYHCRTHVVPARPIRREATQMKRALCSLFFLLLSSAAYADSARMPDGTEFPMWEKPLHFTKTYYVDNQRRTPTTTAREQRSTLPHDQPCGAGSPAGGARGDCRRRLSRVYPSGARRHRARRDDQLRGRAGRQGRGQGLAPS